MCLARHSESPRHRPGSSVVRAKRVFVVLPGAEEDPGRFGVEVRDEADVLELGRPEGGDELERAAGAEAGQIGDRTGAVDDERAAAHARAAAGSPGSARPAGGQRCAGELLPRASAPGSPRRRRRRRRSSQVPRSPAEKSATVVSVKAAEGVVKLRGGSPVSGEVALVAGAVGRLDPVVVGRVRRQLGELDRVRDDERRVGLARVELALIGAVHDLRISRLARRPRDRRVVVPARNSTHIRDHRRGRVRRSGGVPDRDRRQGGGGECVGRAQYGSVLEVAGGGGDVVAGGGDGGESSPGPVGGGGVAGARPGSRCRCLGASSSLQLRAPQSAWLPASKTREVNVHGDV